MKKILRLISQLLLCSVGRPLPKFRPRYPLTLSSGASEFLAPVGSVLTIWHLFPFPTSLDLQTINARPFSSEQHDPLGPHLGLTFVYLTAKLLARRRVRQTQARNGFKGVCINPRRAASIICYNSVRRRTFSISFPRLAPLATVFTDRDAVCLL